MSWQVMAILFTVLGGIAIDICLHSRTTINYSALQKTFLCLCALAFVLGIAYRQVKDRYTFEHVIPVSIEYVKMWGNKAGYAVTPTVPAKVVYGEPKLDLVIDGSALSKYSEKFELIAVVGHFLEKDGSYMDNQDISKSAAYRITDDDIVVSIPLSQMYLDEVAMGSQVDNYLLLAVPIGFSSAQFKTLKDAVDHGAQIIAKRATFHPQ